MNLVAELVLVDTWIWVPFFNRPGSLEKETVDRLLDDDRCVIVGPILAEVLQGFRRDAEADWVASILKGLRYVEASRDEWVAAARLGRQPAGRGHRLPLRDLLIAATAIRRGFSVCTIDPHFDLVDGLLRFSVT